MLRTLCRLDKMAALRSRFQKQGMMEGSTLSYTEMIMAGGRPIAQGQDDKEQELGEDEDLGPSAGPTVLSSRNT